MLALPLLFYLRMILHIQKMLIQTPENIEQGKMSFWSWVIS
jgi:hypothetical protein